MNARKLRPGFTLLETLLALALIVVLLTLAWPLLQGPLERHKLRRSADIIRTQWSEARNLAMLNGEAVAFRYLADTGEYQLEVSNESADVAVAAQGSIIQSRQSEAMAVVLAQGVLPEGIYFGVPKASNGAWGAAVPGAAGANGEWSTPIVFAPDGTAEDAEIVLHNERGDEVTVHLRGLTGVVTVFDLVPAGERSN